MKRIWKNIITIVIILLLGLSLGFTIYHVSSNTGSTKTTMKTMNDKENEGEDNTTPPEKPDGESDNSQNDNTTPPEKPDGEDNNSQNNNNSGVSIKPMEREEENIEWYYYAIIIGLSISISILIIYLIMSNFNKLTIKETLNNKDKIIIYILSSILLSIILSTCSLIIKDNISTSSDNFKIEDNSNINNSEVSYSAIKTISTDEDLEDTKLESSSEDENVILVDNAKSNINGVTITKTGDSDSGDNTSFYGINSAILAKNGANVTIKNASITTNAFGANGVFSYGGSLATNNSSGDNTTVNISDSTITTKKDNSGGIMTTGGGIMNATNLKVTTSGTSSAAIRSDRGGGEVTVNKGTYKTTGVGSPSIYSTANINVSNASLISTKSEGIVIEGKNSVSLDNVTLTDTNNKLNGKSTTYKNIFLYQSMSGDAESGTSTFTSKNSKITTNKGDTFYVTNTTAVINLENNSFINNDSSGYFLRIKKDSWGTDGSNGGDVTLNLTNQTVDGNIYVDELSTLVINMETSDFTGYINNENTGKSIKLVLSKSSNITLTKDTYITSLENEDTTNSNINLNGYKLYVNNKSI